MTTNDIAGRLANQRQPKILVTVPMDHLAETRTILEAAGTVEYLQYPARDELAAAVPAAVALFPNARTRLDASILDLAPDLRVICTPSIGTDHIDLAYCSERGIPVLSLQGATDLLRTVSTTAEHAFGLMLATVKQMPWSFQSVLEGRWQAAPFKGRDLQGRCLGIVGFGVIGARVARYARAFEMDVVGFDPLRRISKTEAAQVDRDELLARAEIISLHVPLTEQTRSMVDRSWFRQMDGTYLVNTSRGCVIHETDLIDALDAGNVKAAGLDVLCGEADGSIDQHPLVVYARTHSNVFITPHTAGTSYDGQAKTFAHAARLLAQHLGETRR